MTMLTDSSAESTKRKKRPRKKKSDDFINRQEADGKTEPWPQFRHSIAMICDFFYPRLGGVENHIWSLSQELLQLGHKVIVITHAYSNHEKQRRQGVRYMKAATSSSTPLYLKVYYCPFVTMVDDDILPTFTACLPLLRHILTREHISIVHCHQATSTMANEAAVLAKALTRNNIGTVYTDHSLFAFQDIASIVLNRVLQTTLCTVDAAIAVSHTCRDNLILRARIQPPSKVRVIPNAVDTDKFTPLPKQHMLADSPTIKIVVVSRLVYRKGVDLLVGIVPTICRMYPDVDFIIGGEY
jgi:phosphatidylinositol N-acetylglucosaminyltransferase subunit A